MVTLQVLLLNINSLQYLLLFFILSRTYHPHSHWTIQLYIFPLISIILYTKHIIFQKLQFLPKSSIFPKTAISPSEFIYINKMGKGKPRGKKGQQDAINKLYNEAYKLNSKEVFTMFKEATVPEDVTVFLEDAEFVDKAEDMAVLDKAKEKIVKSSEREVPWNSKLKLRDIQLDVRGPNEDSTYALDPFLIKNVRRGNTVITLEQPDGKLKTIFGRKGLCKFFDMKVEFIEPESRLDLSQLSMDERNMKNYQLAGPFKALLSGHKVDIVKTLKANGENAQVSFSPEVGAWVISSKNRALIARNKLDVDAFPDEQCLFAKEIAYCWFRRLGELSDDFKNKDFLRAMEKDFSNRTLVGEYVGNPTHQHMVLYNRETIIFYALVENESPEICWPIDRTLALFKSYQLDVVSVQSLGLYSDFNSLCDGLLQTFRDVAKGKIVEEEEGSVLYLTQRDKSGDSSLDRVLSLSKLKTIEYRIFRKMREKLRGYYHNQEKEKEKGGQVIDSSSSIVAKFKKEMKDLLKGNELPKPIEYYEDILKAAFVFIHKNPLQLTTLNEEQNCSLQQTKNYNFFYITFQQNLLNWMAEQDEFEDFDTRMFDSQVLDVQDKIEYKAGTEVTSESTNKGGAGSLEKPTKIPKKHLLYDCRFILFAPPKLLSDTTLETLSQNFYYSADKTFYLEAYKTLFFTPNVPPVYHCYTFGPTLIPELAKAIELFPNTTVVSFGFTALQVSESIDKLKKEQFLDFPKSGAALNKFFQDQIQLLEEVVRPSFSESKRYHDMNDDQTECKRMVNKLLHLRDNTAYTTMTPAAEEQKGGAGCAEESPAEEKKSPVEESKVVEAPAPTISTETLYANLKAIEEQAVISGEKIVLAIVPFGIPGSGKSTFEKTLRDILKKLNWTIATVSSDGIRGEEMDKIMQQQPKLTKDEAFDKTGKRATDLFLKQVEKMCKEADKTYLQYLMARKLILSNALKSLQESLQVLLKDMKEGESIKVNGYESRPTYHVTTLFMRKDAKKLEEPAFKEFEEGKRVDIEIRGMIVVPGKIVAGICFPQALVDNEFPHMTFLTGSWQAQFSNQALKDTCSQSQPFYDLYEKARDNFNPDWTEANTEYVEKKYINRTESTAYFVVLEKPVTFEGIMHAYF